MFAGRPERPGWRVLLIGGPSGGGKSTVAEQIGLRLGISWLQVDDLRLALQWSRVTLPAGTEARAKWLYGCWLAAEAQRRSPVNQASASRTISGGTVCGPSNSR